MELTSFGYALLPLCVAAVLAPTWQLQIVLLAGGFGAAAPLVIGGLGLPPGVIPASMFMAYVVLQYLLGARFPAAGPALRTIEPILLMAAYALVTAVLVPRLFAGAFTVWPQKLAPPYDLPVPIAPSMSNVTQCFYLLTDVALLAAVALHLGRAPFDPARLLRGYLVTGLVVVAISFWQAGAKLAGIWFPAAFLYSNPGWAILSAQAIDWVPRINGPFAEPAALAYYLAGQVFCCTWLLLRGHRERLAWVVLPGALVALLLSTSTTGYAVLGMGGAGLAVYGATRAPRRMAVRIFAIAAPIAALGIASGLAISSLSDTIEASIDLITRASLRKSEGDSFLMRTTIDRDSLAVLIPTLGFGAGWGSVRAASLVPGMLANLGVFGAALALWFVVRLARLVLRARHLARLPAQALALDGLSAAIAGHLTAALVSAPSLNAPDLYVLFGALIACAARVHDDAARQHRARLAQAA